MKHVVGDAHWHSPIRRWLAIACVRWLAIACVSVVSKRAVSEGLGSDPIIISRSQTFLTRRPGGPVGRKNEENVNNDKRFQ